MTFGEKLRKSRLALNLSQIELAEIAGITERTIYNYEQTSTSPKPDVLKKLAAALNVTVNYLLDDGEHGSEISPLGDKHAGVDLERFITTAKKGYGYKGAKEAREVITRAAALFAGGDLDDKAKEVFYQSLTEVYLESKAEAREKFANRQRVSRKRKTLH